MIEWVHHSRQSSSGSSELYTSACDRLSGWVSALPEACVHVSVIFHNAGLRGVPLPPLVRRKSTYKHILGYWLTRQISRQMCVEQISRQTNRSDAAGKELLVSTCMIFPLMGNLRWRAPVPHCRCPLQGRLRSGLEYIQGKASSPHCKSAGTFQWCTSL
jgi:hypothetical protein